MNLPDNIKQLETLYRAARSVGEKEILFRGIQILSPEQAEQLQEVIIRGQVREMPMEGLVALVAEHKTISGDQADIVIRDMIFDQLLDRTRMRIMPDATAKGPTRPAATTPAVQAGPTVQRPRGSIPATKVPPITLREDSPIETAEGAEQAETPGELRNTMLVPHI